jgi:hypothetical protein
MADLEARVRELENMVQDLRDREAIRDLRYRYHEYVNEGKFADIPGLFTADGELDFAHHLGQAVHSQPYDSTEGRPRTGLLVSRGEADL